jgi:hypothetical protein
MKAFLTALGVVPFAATMAVAKTGGIPRPGGHRQHLPVPRKDRSHANRVDQISCVTMSPQSGSFWKCASRHS